MLLQNITKPITDEDTAAPGTLVGETQDDFFGSDVDADDGVQQGVVLESQDLLDDSETLDPSKSGMTPVSYFVLYLYLLYFMPFMRCFIQFS